MLDSSPLPTLLKSESVKALEFYEKINKNDSLFRYQSDKWSIRQLLGHICDSEQIFCFRLLSIARNEQQALPGFDENHYVQNADFDSIDWHRIRKRFELLREHTILMVENLSGEGLNKSGLANEAIFSVEDLIKIIIGHEMHHRKFIEDNYLPKM